ncbi:hypothetical protein DIJ64_07660 [Mycobacterium leprae]|uniref:Uncharacterized protein n=1 Tax=Mycobacterium leprae TaxID=1769 RepID=A0AAD0KS66_MYCLR|nr:hypothetical protein DIJ64_07660 [Mycobacterium leprae]
MSDGLPEARYVSFRRSSCQAQSGTRAARGQLPAYNPNYYDSIICDGLDVADLRNKMSTDDLHCS